MGRNVTLVVHGIGTAAVGSAVAWGVAGTADDGTWFAPNGTESPFLAALSALMLALPLALLAYALALWGGLERRLDSTALCLGLVLCLGVGLVFATGSVTAWPAAFWPGDTPDGRVLSTLTALVITMPGMVVAFAAARCARWLTLARMPRLRHPAHALPAGRHRAA